MDDGSNVRPVQFRREFQNLPRQKQQKKKKDEKRDEEQSDDQQHRRPPPDPEGSSTIDVTA